MFQFIANSFMVLQGEKQQVCSLFICCIWCYSTNRMLKCFFLIIKKIFSLIPLQLFDLPYAFLMSASPVYLGGS